MVYDHLNCHTAAPDTGQTFGNVGSSVKPAVATLTVGSQILGDTQPGRDCTRFQIGSIQNFELTGLIELDRLEPGICHRQTLTFYEITSHKLVLCLGPFSDSDKELFFLISDRAS